MMKTASSAGFASMASTAKSAISSTANSGKAALAATTRSHRPPANAKLVALHPPKHRNKGGVRGNRKPKEVIEVEEVFYESEEEVRLPTPPPEEEVHDVDVVAELHAAARRNDALRVRLILGGSNLGKACNPEAPNENWETALITAAREGHTAACAALLDGKADPLARDCHHHYFGDAIWPSERDPNKWGTKAPPFFGARSGRTAIYQLCLDGNLDQVLSEVFPMTRQSVVRTIATALQEYHGRSAMVVAANEGNSHLTALLLMNSTALPPSITGKVALFGNATAAQSAGSSLPPLAASGALPSLKPDRGQALVAACMQKEWKTVQVLLAGGVGRASLDSSKSISGATALHLAAAAGEERVVRKLLAAGASTTVYDEFGKQPLHEAAMMGNAPVVKLLLDSRADPRAKSNGMSLDVRDRLGARGFTAFWYAREREDEFICDMLREYGGGDD